MLHRNALSVLPDPVGATTSACLPCADRLPGARLRRRRLRERRREPGARGLAEAAQRVGRRLTPPSCPTPPTAPGRRWGGGSGPVRSSTGQITAGPGRRCCADQPSGLSHAGPGPAVGASRAQAARRAISPLPGGCSWMGRMTEPAPARLTGRAGRAAGGRRRGAGGAGTPGSGPAGSRCTPSTCRPTGTTPGWCRRTARRRWRPSTSTRARSPSWSATTTSWRGCGPSCEAEPVEDLRVDFEDGYVGRSDEDETADVERAARALAAEPAGGRRRRRSAASGSSASRPRPAQPQHPDADGVRRDPARQRREPRRLGGHAAQGDQRRPGRGDGPRRRDAGPAVRDPGRDPAVDPRPGRHGAGRPDGARRRRAADRAALRHLRLLGVHAASRRRTSRSSTRSPTTPSWSCRRRPPAPASGSPTARPTCSRSATPTPWSSAWRNHHRLVRRSLEHGFYQGWDLHPAQLPTRYAATYAFYREGLASALDRLEAYVGHVEGGDRGRAGHRPRPGQVRAPRAGLRGRRRRPRCAGSTCAAFSEAPLGSADGHRVGSEPVRQGGEPRRPDRPRHARATRSATSTCRPRCAASSPTPTSPATSRRCCRPTPRRTPRSPTPSCTASPRPEDYALALGPPAASRRRRPRPSARSGSRSTPGTGSATTRSSAAAAPCAPAFVTVGRDARAASSPASRSSCCMNSTDSEFKGFLKDEFTTLAETDDRILATSLVATLASYSAPTSTGTTSYDAVLAPLLETFAGTYSRALQETLYAMGTAVLEAHPGIADISFAAPNKHHFLVDFSGFDVEGLTNDGEVFIAADRPYGLIEATVDRGPSRRPARCCSAAWRCPRWADDVLAGQPYAGRAALLGRRRRRGPVAHRRGARPGAVRAPADRRARRRAVAAGAVRGRPERRRHRGAAGGRQRGVRGAVRPGLPDPGGRARRRRDPGRARPAAAATTTRPSAPRPSTTCARSRCCGWKARSREHPVHPRPRHRRRASRPPASGSCWRPGPARRWARASPTTTGGSARSAASSAPATTCCGSRRGYGVFFPEVVVVFTIADERHHHVPLLLSPYGYSTYRGS